MKSTTSRKPRRPVSASPKIAPIVLRSDGTINREYTEEELRFFEGWQPSIVVSGKDIEESCRVGRAIHAIPKQCWLNARKAIMTLEEYAYASLIEGWAVVAGALPIEHAWIVRDGVLVDPTLPSESIEYFAGLEFRGRSGIEAFLMTPRGSKCRKTAFFYAFGWGGMESPSFQSCYYDMRMALDQGTAVSRVDA
jgi:hypothetical protein